LEIRGIAFRTSVSARSPEGSDRPVLLNPVLYHSYFSHTEKYWSWRLYSAHRTLSIVDLFRIPGNFGRTPDYRNTGFSRLYGQSGSRIVGKWNGELKGRGAFWNNPGVRCSQSKRQAWQERKGSGLLRHFEVQSINQAGGVFFGSGSVGLGVIDHFEGDGIGSLLQVLIEIDDEGVGEIRAAVFLL
jgi:hypothetical protein